MINRVTIILNSDGFQMDGRLTIAADNNVNSSQHNLQTYELVESGASLVSGDDWSELGLEADLVSAANQSVIAASKIARNLKDGVYRELMSVTVDVGAGTVDCQVTSTDGESVLMHYSWDENAKMKTPTALTGNAEKIDSQFLEDLREAAFGRLGLLSRTMLNATKKKEPIDDMGSLRWA